MSPRECMCDFMRLSNIVHQFHAVMFFVILFFTSGLIIGCILCVFDICVWVQADEALRRLFKSDFA